MRKYIYILLTVLILILMLFYIISRGRKESESDRNETFYNAVVADDSQTLDNLLTREYELSELRTYFEGSNVNEKIGFGISNQSLMFNEVNKCFPIEVIRTDGYFTAYISSSVGQEAFDSLEKGISTAQDVKAIDPSFELSFLISNGIYFQWDILL